MENVLHKCEYCKKEFVKESTLANHLCVKKRRWQQKDEKGVRIGFMVWKRFYELKMPKGQQDFNYEDFMETSLYSIFVRFGRHLEKLNAIHPDRYIDFLIKHNVKVDDWCKEYPYESYLREFIAMETPEQALERSLHVMEEWGETEKEDYLNFFSKINTNVAVAWIQNGKISPWMILCVPSSVNLLNRFTEEQKVMTSRFLEPRRWKAQIKRHQEEFDNIREVLKEIGA